MAMCFFYSKEESAVPPADLFTKPVLLSLYNGAFLSTKVLDKDKREKFIKNPTETTGRHIV